MVAERTRLAREQEKKAAAEASVIIANNNAKSPPPPEPKEEKSFLSGIRGLSVSQWISVGGLVVSAAGLFLKREEIVAAVKKNLPSPPPLPEPPAAPAPPVDPAPQRKVLRKVP